MLGINLTSCFAAIQCVLPAMTARGWGRIVSIASTAGLKGYAYTAAYCAAKHGLIGLTRALALELARTGVTVNAVCPGFTDTELVAAPSTRSSPRPARPRGGRVPPWRAATRRAAWCSRRRWPRRSPICAATTRRA